jgi:hypothetical protein
MLAHGVWRSRRRRRVVMPRSIQMCRVIRERRGSFGDAPLAFTCWFLKGIVAFIGFLVGHAYIPRASPAGSGGLLHASRIAGAFWYAQIAEQGYSYGPFGFANAAFFPAYPLASALVHRLTGLPTEVALLLVSNASFLGALILLAGYLRARTPTETDRGVELALLAIALFPTGCFFRLGYTESTFLLLMCGTMYGLERRWPLPAVLAIAGLATATRGPGVALLGPLSVYLWNNQRAFGPRVSQIGLCLPCACWGLLSFMAFQYVVNADALAPVHAQQGWRVGPAHTVPDKLLALAALKPLFAVYDPASPTYWAAWDPHDVPFVSLCFANPIFFAGAAALTVVGAYKRWLTTAELSLVSLLLLIPYCTRADEMWMQGMGRFVAVAFPIYIVLGHVLLRLPLALRVFFFIVCGLYLGLYSALFASGYTIN